MGLRDQYRRSKKSRSRSSDRISDYRPKGSVAKISTDDGGALEPVGRTYGLEPMINGFLERDPDKFWSNLWYVFLASNYHECDHFLSWNKRSGDCARYSVGTEEYDRCINRRIGSGRCLVTDAWWAKIPFFNIPEEKRGKKDWCINVQPTAVAKACKKLCSDPSRTILEDGSPAVVEAYGCDGYTPWCWCNKKEYGGGGFQSGDGGLSESHGGTPPDKTELEDPYEFVT